MAYEDFIKKYGSAPQGNDVTEEQRKYRISQLQGNVRPQKGTVGQLGKNIAESISGGVKGIGTDIGRNIATSAKTVWSGAGDVAGNATQQVASIPQGMASMPTASVPSKSLTPIAEGVYPGKQSPLKGMYKQQIEQTYPSSEGLKQPSQIVGDINAANQAAAMPSGVVNAPTIARASLKPGEFSVVNPLTGKTTTGNAEAYVRAMEAPRSPFRQSTMAEVEEAKKRYEEWKKGTPMRERVPVDTRELKQFEANKAFKQRQSEAEASRANELAIAKEAARGQIGKAEEERKQAEQLAEATTTVKKEAQITAANKARADVIGDLLKAAETPEEKAFYAKELAKLGGITTIEPEQPTAEPVDIEAYRAKARAAGMKKFKVGGKTYDV